jgi:hypothetical protein
MRIRNKELRNRWHRKEQRVKELIRQARAAKEDKPAPERPASKPRTAAKRAAPPKDEAAAKPKRAPRKKPQPAPEPAEPSE